MSRLAFFFYNYAGKEAIEASQILRSFFYGLRFDFIVIYYVNIVFILIHLIPGKLIRKILQSGWFVVVLVTINSLLLFTNFIDTGYYSYLGRRSSWGTVSMLFLSPDTTQMIPAYLLTYWHLLLLFLVFVLFMLKYFPRNLISFRFLELNLARTMWVSVPFALFLFMAGFGFARGLEGKPIRMISANRYTSPQYISLLINTPFSLLNTFNQSTMMNTAYFPEDELSSYFSPVQKFTPKQSFRNKNVVIIILESFGVDYADAVIDGQHVAPFFQTLKQQGFYCESAFANSRNSMDALPAIVSGLPALLNTSFVAGEFSVNKINGLANILAEQGYSTAFYHGANNGSMGFDIFASSVGFERYIGRSEFDNDTYYDGAWGIWDEQFFQFAAADMSGTPEPFLGVVFSISLHHPYYLPEEYDTLCPGGTKIIKAIAYTDLALQRFFETVSKSSWYENTLFVVVADHTSTPLNAAGRKMPERMQIPILYYAPGDSSLIGVTSAITQQIDIMPSVLDYLNYSGKLVCYGKSVFDTAAGYRASVHLASSGFNMIDSAYLYSFSGEVSGEIIQYKQPGGASDNPSTDDSSALEAKELYLKAYLQDYYFRLNNNKMTDTSVNVLAR